VTAITRAVDAWNQAAQNAEAARQAEIAPALAAWTATEASAWAQRQTVVAAAQEDYDHALAGLQDQANAAWDEYAQAMEAAGCPRRRAHPVRRALVERFLGFDSRQHWVHAGYVCFAVLGVLVWAARRSPGDDGPSLPAWSASSG
jgi:hypothetical protein